MSAKDIKKIRRRLKKQGWTEETTGGDHIRMNHPKGGFVTMSLSPSCPYALKNIEGDIKRLERSHEQG